MERSVVCSMPESREFMALMVMVGGVESGGDAALEAADVALAMMMSTSMSRMK